MAGSDTSERILRAKYLDWCSARVAERFLALTPDEIYELAEVAAHGQPNSVDPIASLSPFFDPALNDHAWQSALDPSTTTRDAEPFRMLVSRVTEVLADRIGLPTFEEWSAAYQESPRDFDNELLGFWKEEADQ
jgi:hypothetical protein